MATADLVKDDRCFLTCLLRMHMSNEAFVFCSATRDFRIMLRNDPIDATTVAFEICVVSDEKDNLVRTLEMEHDGYLDVDDNLFVMDSFSYSRDEIVKDPEILSQARTRLNEIHAFRLCRCGNYFIKDVAKMCLYCQLTEESMSAPEHFCAICHETSIEKHMVKQPCCGQLLHRACIAKWEGTSGQTTCPLCRCSARAT